MAFIIVFENEKQILKDLSKIPTREGTKIRAAINQKLTTDPIKFGKPLQGSLHGYRRLRVGDYRVVFRIDALNSKIIITTIKHRKDVYEK